ncbi:MAG TPA: LacI family DNA-binding transcriptional regulator [Candidatus Limiplasma sp.]|nr:LacI family DNA-binding transcriptional regulator [Candidatus Limiplasma sp.]
MASPLYEKIQKDMIEKLQDGTYHDGDRIPSEKEIAEQYGVSRITAVKALTELSLSGYIRRIQGKGSFANSLDKHLRTSALQLNVGAKPPAGPRRVGVMIPEHFDYHSGSIIQSLTQDLFFPEYFVQLFITRQAGMEEYALDYVVDNGFSGVILFPVDCEYYSDTILRMHLNKFPLVLIDRSFPGIQSSSVSCDNEAGCQLALEHLLALGHRHIAFVADCTFKEQITSIRYNSYVKVMTGNHLRVHPYESFCRHGSSPEDYVDFLSAVRQRRITAAVVSNSHAARRLYEFCRRNDLSVPEDLSIICFDLPYAYHAGSDDFFTYVEQGSLEIGHVAAKMLREAIESDDPAPCRQVLLNPTLVVHHSTSTPKEDAL